MKKFILILIMILSIMFVGCSGETYANGVPTYFIEPDGYVIAEIKTSSLFKYYYGYISEDDYNSFLSGYLEGALTVLNPYEDGKSIAVNCNNITSISIGIYKDIRN